MEEDERIPKSEWNSSRTRPRWLISVVAGIVICLSATAISISTMVVPLPTLKNDQRTVDLSIALDLKNDQFIHKNGTTIENPLPGSLAQLSPSSGNEASLGTVVSVNQNTAANNCFPFNTVKWLTSNRIQNLEGLDLAASFQLLLPPSTQADNSYNNNKQGAQFQAALDETICIKGSRFLNPGSMNTTINKEYEDANVRTWTTRLVYFAINFHQHYQAWEEFNHRQQVLSNNNSSECQKAWETHHMSISDYECPKAKFLVIAMSDNGLGANLKLGAMVALKASLATGRVALYINNFNHTRHGWLKKNWTLTSCPRRDYQCFFMPPSPCVLTHDDYQNAYLLNKTDMRTLFRTGTLPHLEDTRVVVYLPSFRPQREPPRMRERLAKIGQFLVHQGMLPDIPLVHEAIKRIATPTDETRVAYQGDDELAGGLLLYVTRPRPEYLQQLQTIHANLLGSQKQSDASIGLPIRGECIIIWLPEFVADL